MTEMLRTITNHQPSFSLILCTYGRAEYLERLLRSLSFQSDVDFELVVVDQNPDERLTGVLRAHAKWMEIRHIRAQPGLSSARNVGIRAARGRIIAFPDDDCWYSAGHLAAVQRALVDECWDGLTCRCTDEQGRLAAGAEDRRPGPVTKWNVWGRGVSATLFLKRHVIAHVGYFDEMLGLGACSEFQSGEETVYLLRDIVIGLFMVLV
jgi:glycosyltransferase involved in cell wall biosynthesis